MAIDSRGAPIWSANAISTCATLQVAATQGYAALSKRQTDLITAEACAALARYQSALQVWLCCCSFLLCCIVESLDLTMAEACAALMRHQSGLRVCNI